MKKTAAFILAMAVLLSCCAGAFADGNGGCFVSSVGSICGRRYSVPETDGIRFVRELRLGWNLGNTFDAYDYRIYKGG